MVDVAEERRPDLASTCFRARARLLRFRDPSRVATDEPRFAGQATQARGKSDSRVQSSLIWGAVITGVVVGVLTGILVRRR